MHICHAIMQLYEKEGKEPPLHAWWAILPPPFDLIVGLRQVFAHELRRERWRERVWERKEGIEGRSEGENEVEREG